LPYFKANDPQRHAVEVYASADVAVTLL